VKSIAIAAVAGLAAGATAQNVLFEITSDQTQIDLGQEATFELQITNNTDSLLTTVARFQFFAELDGAVTGGTVTPEIQAAFAGITPAVGGVTVEDDILDPVVGLQPNGNFGPDVEASRVVGLLDFDRGFAGTGLAAGETITFGTWTYAPTEEGELFFSFINGTGTEEGGRPGSANFNQDPLPFEVTSGSVTVVPTPGTLAMLGLGGLAAARRRR